MTTPIKSNVLRVVGAVALINSQEFSKQAVTEQTKILQETAGKTPLFVENFSSLSNPALIRDKLLRGEDVTIELDFNDVVLSPEEHVALSRVRPILDKIANIGPKYPWEPEVSDDRKALIKIGANDKYIHRDGYKIGAATAKSIWNKASRWWGGGKFQPASEYKTVDSYSKQITYTQQGVKIGCQEVRRDEIEYIARLMGWLPNV